MPPLHPSSYQARQNLPLRRERKPLSGVDSRPASLRKPGSLPKAASLPNPASQPDPQIITGGEAAALQALSSERQELLCSLIGLALKVGLVVVAGVSLVRLATAYQERMERQGELSAVLGLERAKLSKARERFDHLFMVEGEQRLIREQNQWIAPNRLRVVWQQATP
jgi:hypothetical protein